jgi:Protein of unknown function (DUF1566)
MRHHSTTRSRRTTASACLLCLLVWGVSGARAGDGVVALQTAAASCADPTSTDRYIDCGNGTVTDNTTGLVWLADANCLGGFFDWSTAMEFVAGLSDKPVTSAAAAEDCGLSDGSSPGEWRLPSVEEWEAMVADAVGACSPTITNDAGDDCWDAACVTAGACSFSGVGSSFYWSASTRLDDPTYAWLMNLLNGVVANDDKSNGYYVWPVRGGQ